MTIATAPTTEIVVATPAPVPAFRRQALVEHFLEGLDPKTREEYGRGLRSFAAFATAAYELALPPERLIEDWFLTLSGGEANEAALRYRSHLERVEEYAPKTVNQKLSALRSVVRLAKLLGRVHWTLDVKNLKARAIRDTRGTGYDGYRKLLAANRERYGDVPIGRRNEAMLRLLFELALRKDSVLSLRRCDVDLERGEVRPLVKKRGRHDSNREARTLPAPTRRALAAWMDVHPLAACAEAPLFVSLDRAYYGHALSAKGAWEVVRNLGTAAGIGAWPHALRHAAATHALDVTNGDVRRVQKFMGHASPATTMIYDDARLDLAGQVARLIADD
jgi:integrase/recombinase XerC